MEMIFGMKIHSAASTLPLLEGESFERLVESIRKEGLRMPIEVTASEEELERARRDNFHDWPHIREVLVVDGRNRLRALERLLAEGVIGSDYVGGMQMERSLTNEWGMNGETIDDDFVRRYVESLNIDRRHLTPDQIVTAKGKLLGPAIKAKTAAKAKASTSAAGKASGKARGNADTDSYPRSNAEKNAESAAGQLAKESKVGHGKAADALAVMEAAQISEEIAADQDAVIAGTKTLREVAPKAKAVLREKKTSPPPSKPSSLSRDADIDELLATVGKWPAAKRVEFAGRLLDKFSAKLLGELIDDVIPSTRAVIAKRLGIEGDAAEGDE